MNTQQILEALDTDEKVIALAKALHENGAMFSIVLNGKPITFDDGGGTGALCSEGFHWDDVLKKCVEDVG